VEALRWVRDPANRAEAAALLGEKFKLPARTAERTYQLLVEPSFGFNVDARLDPEGFRNLRRCGRRSNAGRARRWRPSAISIWPITSGRSPGSADK
jgi:hypothetical protein